MSKLFTAMMLSTALLAAGAANGADLRVDVDGVKEARGNLVVVVYSGADNFLTVPFKQTVVPAALSANSVVIKDVPAGEYAVSVFQDTNSNDKLEFQSSGAPAEPYAFSNDVAGQPSYAKSKFALSAGGTSIRVKLQ